MSQIRRVDLPLCGLSDDLKHQSVNLCAITFNLFRLVAPRPD